MHRRQLLPHLWMMTDERLGPDLPQAVARLPRGTGIVFRHYSLGHAERRRLFEQVRSIARARGLILLLAGHPRVALAWGADGSHGLPEISSSGSRLLRSASVHDLPQLRQAHRTGMDFVFASPVFDTRSHPGGREIGPVRLGLLIRASSIPVIALGGMNRDRAKRLGGLRIAGWAGIHAWRHAAKS